jgi:hypothetical protein
MRQRPAVIDVRMREHDEVDGLRIKRKVLVPLDGVLPTPLIEAAIEQNALAIHFEEVL